jgi:5'(3')-deoxyribonucleotidase
MNIGIDVDGVVADFNDAYADLLTRVTGRALPVPYEPKTWDWPAAEGFTRDDNAKAHALAARSQHFWEQLNALPGARDVLRELHYAAKRGHAIYFITNRFGTMPKHQTEVWLNRHGYPFPTVLVAADKGLAASLLSLDWYADDKTENVASCVAVGVYTVRVVQPWNAPVPGAHDLQPEELAHAIASL